MTARARFLSNNAIVASALRPVDFLDDGSMAVLTNRATRRFSPIYLDNGGPKTGRARYLSNRAFVAAGLRQVRFMEDGRMFVLTDEAAETFSEIYLDNGFTAEDPAEEDDDEAELPPKDDAGDDDELPHDDEIFDDHELPPEDDEAEEDDGPAPVEDPELVEPGPVDPPPVDPGPVDPGPVNPPPDPVPPAPPEVPSTAPFAMVRGARPWMDYKPAPGATVLKLDSILGDDANDGFLLPKATLAGAAAVARPGMTWLLAGWFEGTLDMSALPDTKIMRDGTRPAEINGGAALAGFAPADAQDTVLSGAHSGVFVARGVPVSRFPGGNPGAAMPIEDGTALVHAVTLQGGSREVNNDNWLTGEPIADANGRYIGVRIPGLRFTAENVAQAQVLHYGGANHNLVAQPGAVTPETQTIMFAAPSQAVAPIGNVDRNRVALKNFAPALKVGGWFYMVDPGGQTCSIYVKPRDPSRVNLSIRCAARGRGLWLGNAQGVEVYGVAFRQFCDWGLKTNLQYPVAGAGGNHRTKIVDCVIEDVERGAIMDYSAIYLTDSEDVLIRNNTIRRAKNMFGIFAHGRGAFRMKRPVIAFNWLEEVDNTPVRYYGCDKLVDVFNGGINCGDSAHANAGNAYEGNTPQLVYGNAFRGNAGYWTNQEAWAMDAAMSVFPTGSRDGKRAFDTQNKPSQDVPATTVDVGSILCCMMPPFGLGAGIKNATMLGDGSMPGVRYYCRGVISHGIMLLDGATTPLPQGGDDILTAGPKVWPTDVQTTPEALYVDPAKGDWRYRPDAVIHAMPRLDLKADFDGLRATYPHAPAEIWGRDVTGRRFDERAAPIGPVTDYTADPYAWAWEA